jgi:hypothetical protein
MARLGGVASSVGGGGVFAVGDAMAVSATPGVGSDRDGVVMSADAGVGTMALGSAVSVGVTGGGVSVSGGMRKV